MMTVELRSDQPSKMTPKNILWLIKQICNEPMKITALQSLFDWVTVKGHDSKMCHTAIMDKNHK